MTSKKDDIYVLGTGLSHDGSACLLRNGKVVVAIEKERVTRNKHAGGNDTEAIRYCLETAGIALNDLSLIVQNSNFGFFEFGNHYFQGTRLFTEDLQVPVVTISHHLAHAYYALGTCPYDDTSILVIDGCGSLYDECIDLKTGISVPDSIPQDINHLYAEKDSFYHYRNGAMKTVYKDFSPFGYYLKEYPMHPPTTKHSIGGVYMAASHYCFSNMDDVGKLMGLAPFGRAGIYNDSIFDLRDGRVFVDYEWTRKFNRPARSMSDFWNNFQYYADIAYWVQRETERAVLYVVDARSKLSTSRNLAYTGGVALNAVANALIAKQRAFDNLYLTPAAGDNGLAIGCAYYGWLEILKKEKVQHNGNSCFGKVYADATIERELTHYVIPDEQSYSVLLNGFFENLPGFVNAKMCTRENYIIKFMFTDAEPYVINIKKTGISRLQQSHQTADCILYTSSGTFIRSLKDREHLLRSIRENKSSVSGDLAYFIAAIKLGDIDALLCDLFVKNTKLRKVMFSEEADVIRKAAALLAEGKVVGWFQDGCEFGPRALGHRSILADPRKKDVQKYINNKIKFREDFRPFAPAILQEDVSEYFHFEGESPYMIMVAQVKDHVKNEISGVVHADNSSRIQTVTPEWNGKFYALIRAFKEITGLPILLNTSFNKKGMPIVETPEQALSFFFECALDCLVMGNFIVYKESQGQLQKQGSDAKQMAVPV